MASPGRVQAPELGLRPSLRPAPVVDVVPVRPVNREGEGSNLMRIAESLSGFGNSLARYGASTRQKQEKPKDYFPDIAQSFTPEQIVSDPRFNVKEDGHRVLFGTNSAHELGRTFQQMVLDEWDPEQEPDLDAFLFSKVKERMDQFEDPTGATQAGFGKTIDTYVKETRDWYDKRQAEVREQMGDQEMWKSIFNVAEIDKDKMSPVERAQAAKAHLDELYSLKMLDGKKANQFLMNTIAQYAELGDVDMVQALASMRRGRNNEVDPIADTPEFSDKIDSMIATANTKWLEQDATKKNDFLNRIDEVIEGGTGNDLTALINSPEGQRIFPDPIDRADRLRAATLKQKEVILNNTVKAEKEAGETAFRTEVVSNFWRMNGGQNYTEREVTLKDGKTHTIPASKAQVYLDEDIRARYEEAAQKGPEAVAELDATLARVAGQSSLKITEWENVFSRVLTGTNTSQLLEGKVPPNVDRAYQLWKNTKGHDAARRANMGSNAEEVDRFFAAVEMSERAGNSTAEAMQQAQLATQPGRWGPAMQRVQEVAWGSGSSNLELRDRFPPQVANDIVERATMYAASAGITAEKAMTKAIADFEEELVKIDVGTTSYVTAPARMNENDRETYGNTVKTFVENQVSLQVDGEMPLDPELLSISEVDPGKFQLFHDGEPIRAMLTHRGGSRNAGVMYFTYEDIQRQLEYDAEASKRETMSETATMNKLGARPLSEVTPDPEGKGRSALGVLRDKLFGGDDEPKKEPEKGLFGGYTGNAEEYFGARTRSQLGELSDFQLRELRKLSKDGKLKDLGFANPKGVENAWSDRVAKERRKSGYSKLQVNEAMSRWNVDELEAIRLMKTIERLKKNNAKPEKD
jgi:hypothetical protein